MVEAFLSRGWACFAPETVLAGWAGHARAAALRALRDPALAHWHQCEGTWFVGVDALDNDGAGRVGGSAPLTGAVVDFIAAHIGRPAAWHRGQISAVFPGYPRPRAGEGAAAFAYRLRRDAAHIDGVMAVGPGRRRMLREPHAFILGLPLNAAGPEAAPLVIWEGSHEIMRRALARTLSGHDPDTWPDIDVTDAYRAARRVVFETCRRVRVHAEPGGAYVMHRLALHGIAPWGEGAKTAWPDGRMIAYFRPPMPGGAKAWLAEP